MTRTALAVLLALSFSAGAWAQAPSITQLFPRVAEVNAPERGLCQLPLSAEVLGAVRPDLSDLRLIDREERVIATMLDRATPQWPTGGLPASMEITPISMDRSRDAETGVAREEIGFQLPETSLPRGATWTLVLVSEAPEFVQRTTLMSPEGALLQEGSVFRLDPQRERLTIPLPAPTPGRIYTLRLEGEGAHLGPTLRLVAGPMADRSTTLSIPLEILSRREDAGATILELARPSGIVPTRLEFQTRTRFFTRQAAAYDLREGHPRAHIGAGRIFRAEEIGAEGLSLPLQRSRGERLQIVITRGDSPPLAELSVRAVTERPALLFTCTQGARLFFGGGRVRAANFDTQRFAGTALGEEIAGGALAEADLASSTQNPSFEEGPALGILHRPGARVDRGLFRSAAPLVVSDAREGVSRFVPSAALLAHSDPNLDDLRVVDDAGHQWPYVRAPGRRELSVPLQVERAPLSGKRTLYRLSYPAGPLAIEELRLHADAGFIHRRYTAKLASELPAMLAPARESAGLLARELGEEAPLQISLNLGAGPVELIVEDGDDAPLALEAEAILQAPVFYLLAPSGSYTALVEASDLPRAEYEVHHALDLILATEVSEAALGEVAPNPSWEPPPVAPLFSASQIAVWITLALAVLLLGLLTLRALREQPTEPSPITQSAEAPQVSSEEPGSRLQTRPATKRDHWAPHE